MADPSFVQAKSGWSATAGTSIAATVPAPFTAGNRAYAIVAGESTVAATISGWTQLFDVNASGFQTLRLTVLYKDLVGGESQTVTATVAAVGTDCGITVVEFSNNGTMTMGTGQDQSFDSTPTTLGQTTAANNAMHVIIVCCAGDADAPTLPASYTGADLIHNNVHFAYRIIAAAGATGDKTWTHAESGGATAYAIGFKIEPTAGAAGVVSRSRFVRQAVNRAATY